MNCRPPWRVTGFSDRVAFLLALPAFDPTLGASAPTVATGAGAVAVLFCRVSDFARLIASAAGPSAGPLVRSTSALSPCGAGTSLRNSKFRPHGKSGKGWSIGRAGMRSIWAWIVTAYLSEPMEMVMIRSRVWIGAGEGAGLGVGRGVVSTRWTLCGNASLFST